MSDYCEDQDCVFFGKKLVNLGWGYPVCKSQFVKLYPIPLDEKYRGFEKGYKTIKCNESKPKRNDKK